MASWGLRSPRCPVPLLLISHLLFLLSISCVDVSSASVPRLCAVVNYHSATAPGPVDGLATSTTAATSSAWNDLAWARDACARNAGASFTFADSDWQSQPSLRISTDLAQLQGLTSSNGLVRRSVTARLSADGARLELLNITIAFRLTLAKPGFASVSELSGVVTKTIVGGLPLEAAASLPVGWYGALQKPISAAAGSLVLYDADLFDGTLPAAVVSGDAISDELLEVAATVREAAGSPALRQVLFDTTPSALTDATLRGAFLNASSLAPVTAADAIGGQVWRSASAAAATGLVLQSRAECRGASCAGLPFVAALEQIVNASIHRQDDADLCASPAVVVDSLRAWLSVDLAVVYSPVAGADLTQASVRVRGMSARSEALFRCAGAHNGSFLGIALSVTAPLSDSVADWPLSALTDQRTSVGLLRAIPLATHGWMAGSVLRSTENGTAGPTAELFTVAPGDLFASDGGGLLLADRALSVSTLKADATAVFAAVQRRLATDVAPIEARLADLFPSKPAAVSAAVEAYAAQTLQPTWLGFLAYHARHHQHQLFVSPDGQLATLSVDFGLPPTQLTADSDNTTTAATIVAQANRALDALGSAVKAKYGGITNSYVVPTVSSDLSNAKASLAGFFTGAVTINCSTSAVAVVVAPQYSALASIKADFAGVSSALFIAADITYDFSSAAGAASTISATPASALQGAMGSTVGLTLEGQLAVDGPWANVPALGPQLQTIANGVAEVTWARGVVRPFVDVDFGRMSASTRLADMISALGTNITANVAPAVRGWALAQRMKADIEAHAAGDATVVVHAHVVPLVGASQTMDVSLVVHSQRRVQLSSAGTTWDSIADTVRLAIPLALTTRLRFSVSASAATGVSFGVRGGGRLTGSWAIPFTYQMLSGAVSNGSAAIDVSLPGGGAKLSLGLDLAATQPATVRNATNSTNSKNQESLALRAEILDDDLVDQLVPAVLVVTQAADGSDATMGTRTISPSRLVSALGEALLPALTQAFTGALNIAVPPLKKPLGSITQFNDLVKAVKPWLTTAADPTLGAARLVQSATFCTATGAPTPLAFNVSINDLDPVRCEAAAPLAPASVDALRADIATMLAGCGLAGYLEAQVIDVERVVTPNESDRQCGHVGLFPAVPGIVWNFAIATGPMPLTANITFGTATYISTPKPAFATWTDLARLLAAVLTHDDADPANAALVAVPEWTTAEASVVVPPELAAYYPSRLPAVAIRVEAQHIAVDHQFELDAQMSTADGVLQLQSHTDVGTGTVRSSLSAALVTVFGAPPLGGRGNISLSTNYDGVNTTANATLVPAAPDNTFALIMGAQLLSTSAPPANVGARQLITLPPGKLLSAALIDDVVPQVDPALRPMLAVYEMPSDGLIYPVTQVRFDLGPHQLADGRWAVPTAFGLEATSQLPALTNASNVPSQSVVLARDVAMRLATRVETVGALLDGEGRSSRRAAPTAEGRIAILGFTSGQHAALSQVEVEVKGVGHYQTMAELYPPRETFFDQFAVGVALNNSAAVGGLQMTDLQRVDTDLPDVRFAQEGRWAVDSLAALKALTTQALTSWTAEFNGTAQAVDTFRSLLHTNDSICTWMGLVSNVSQAIVTAKAAGVRLPFSQHGFGSLLSDSLASSLAELHTSVCVNHEPFSLGTYCRVARGAFGGTTTACANATLSDAGLTVDLIVVPFNRSYVDQLRFDTSSLFNNAQVPVGLGASGDLSLLGEFDFRMRLLARFGGDEGGVSFGLDPAGTYFSARAGFDVQGTLRFYFGPVSLNLLTAHAWLGNPATLIFRLQPTSAADVTALEFVSAEKSSLSSSTELVTVDTWSSPSEVGALIDTKGRLEISGNAGFTAVVGFSTSVQCSIDVGVPDLGAFLAGGQRPSVSQRGCGQGFAQELLKSLLKQSLLDYFSSRFLAQWESGFAQFLGRLFGHAGPLRAGGPAVPLIDKMITALMTDSIGRMSGADAMNRLTTAVNGITTSLLQRNTTADMQKLDQLVLTLITKALCRELAPVLVECPAVPDVTSPEYVWPLHFRGTNSRPLARLGFSLGGHGFAGLDLKCAGAVVMEWDLQFVMAFNRTHGLDFRFDQAPEVFTGDIALEVVGGCGLSGTIGWIGADLSIDQPKLLDGRLTVDPRFQVDLAVRAQIYGKAELGLGGKLAERLAHAPDALDALPHWQATLNLTWGWDLRAPNQALVPKFALTDIRFCVGRLLSHVVSSTVSQTVDRLLRPLEPVLGPNGLLLRPIPGLSDVFGHDLNMIQLLIYACRVNGECQLNGVVDALRTFVDIYHKLDTVRQIAAALEGDGCNVVQLVRDFIVDFNTPVPIPIYDGAIPPGGLQFDGAADANPQLKHTVSAFYSGVVTSGHFGVRLYMFDNIGQNLVSAMLGQDFPLAGVTLPDVTFFVSKEWWIPVWVFPRVDLVLGVNARFTLSFGGVALMYSGLADAYKTGSPGALFGALALPTRNDDGSERWPVQAAIGFKGGVGVSIFIFRGEVYLTIALEGDAAFVDVDQDGWVTFNEIAYLVRLNGIKGAVRLRLVLRAGFGIKIQACIRLLWKRKCWTLFNKHWDRSWPLYDNSRRLFDSIAAASGSQSSVNLGMVSFNPQTGHSALGYDGDDGDGGGHYNGHGVISDDDDDGTMMTMNTTMMTMMKPLAEMRAADQTDLTYSIYQTPEGLTVDFAPMGVGVGSGTPHLSRAGLPSGQTIAAYGNPGATPFTWAVGYVAQTVAMPAYATATLRFLVSEYPGVSAMTVSPQVVSPDTAPGVTVSTCALLHVAQPTTGVAYGVWGVPCATLLESMVTNNVSLAGAAAAYPHPLTLSGEAWAVSSTITATQLTIASGSLSAVDGPSAAQVTLPAAYQVLTVSGDLQRPATYTLADVRTGVTAGVTGGVADDLFVVQGMHLLHGSTTIAGGSGVDASEVTIVTDAGVELDVTVTPAWLVVENALGVANTLRHSSVERRTYLVHGAANTRSRVTLLSPERDDSVVIVAHGAPGSTIAQQITGCDGKSEVRYSFRDGGDHELRIGNNQRVTDMRCTVWLDAIPPGGAGGQTVSVIIEASAETRPLQYDVQENAILIYDVEGDGSFFHLMFDQIQRVQIQFGVGGTVLRMAEGTTGTEFFFDFVDTNATTVNEARIAATNSPVLLAGHLTTVDVGPAQTAIVSVDPLQDILAPVAIAQPAAQLPSALVRLASGTGPRAPAQHYYLDSACLAARDRSSSSGAPSPVHVGTKPSAWLCGLMTQHGLPAAACADPCPVIYTGPINVTIATGWADDSFYAADVVAASVAVSLGPGADNVTWLAVPASAGVDRVTARFDLGHGSDQLLLASPVRNVTVLLGDDTDVDQVAFYSGGLPVPPNVNGNVVAPVGPNGAALTLEQVRLQDLLFVYGGNPSGPLGGGVVAVDGNATSSLPGGHRLGDDRPVVTINVTVPSQVVSMDAQSGIIYHVVGSAQSATVSLNGLGRSQPPFPTAVDWDLLVDVPPSVGLSVTMLAESGSRSKATINIVDQSPGSSVQSVDIRSSNPPSLCSTVVGLLEVRTDQVDHLKIDARRPIAARVAGTAYADLVIVTPDAPAAGSPASSVYLASVENTTLVVNATLTIASPALLASRAIVAAGQRAQLTFDGYAFGSGGASFVDGCLLGAGLAAPSTPFSSWFAGEAAAALGSATAAAAAQTCSFYGLRLASVNLTTPALSLGGLGADRAVRRVNLLQVPAAVTLDDDLQPWARTTIASAALAVDDRFVLDLTAAGGIVTVASPVFGPANASALDVFVSENAETPYCRWLLGAPDNATATNGTAASGATLLMQDARQRVSLYGSSLVSPRHMPRVLLHGPLAVAALLHNATNGTTRDLMLNPASLSVVEALVPIVPPPPPHGNGTTNGTAAFVSALSRREFGDDVSSELNQQPLLHVEWIIASWQEQGYLRVELADGINSVVFNHTSASAAAAAAFQMPTLVVREAAAATLVPPQLGPSRTPSVDLLRTREIKADISTQFLEALPADVGDDEGYCLQPTEQTDRNSWLWLTVRQAPWLEPYLACRPDAELERCRRDHFVSLDLDHQHHRLRAVLHLTPLKNVVPVSTNHSTNHSTAADAGEDVPFVLFVTGAGAVHHPMAVGAPTEWDYGLSVLVLFGGMMAIGFGWWVITGSVIPAAWGPFVITAALAGLVESDTTWDPRVVSIVEAAYWMVSSFVSGCHSLGIFHICVLAVFLGLGALGLVALFLRDSWSRLLVPVVRRAVTALAAVAIPFVIAQAPARAGQSVGWSVFTGALGLCGLFVVASLLFHTFAAIRSRSRRVPAAAPALLLAAVVVGMSILTRLRYDDDEVTHKIIFIAAIVAVAVDSVASLCGMLVLTSLVKGWWRVSPGLISGVTTLTSAGCGFAFLFTLNYSAGLLPIVLWYVWALLPTVAAVFVLVLPCPVITKSTSKKGPTEELGLSVAENERPLLPGEEFRRENTGSYMPPPFGSINGGYEGVTGDVDTDVARL